MKNTLWHDLRAKNIGGSDVAALFDQGYGSLFRLWHEKKGDIEPANLDEDERVQAGKFMESGAIAWANSKWGTQFYQPNVYIKHATIEGMGCTPDAFEVDSGSPAKVIAQVKVVDSKEFREKWEFEGATITEAPLKILLQCQHELSCSGAQENHLIVVVGGNRIYKMIVERDETVIGIIEARVIAFWESIDKGIVPEPNYRDDGDVIRTLRAQLPVVEEEDFTGDEYLGQLIQDLKEASFARKKSADKEEAYRNELIYSCEGIKRIRHGSNIVNFSTNEKGHLRVLIGNDKVVI